MDISGYTHYRFHLAAKYMRQIPHSDYNDKLTFAVFRNPLQRCISLFYFMRGRRTWFEMRKKRCQHLWRLFGDELDIHVDKMLRIIDLAETDKFDMFLEGCFHEDLPITQSYFVCDNDGQLIVDTLCSFDNLNDSVNAVMRKLGRGEIKLVHSLRSKKRRPWRTHYTKRLLGIAENILAHDLEMWENVVT